VQRHHQAGNVGDVGADREAFHYGNGVRITGSAYVYAAHELGAVRDHVIAVFTTGALGLDVGFTGRNFPVQDIRHVGLERAVSRCMVETLADQLDALPRLLQAQVGAAVGIGLIAGDDVEIETVIGKVGLVLAYVACQTAGARIGADDTVGSQDLSCVP